VQETCPGNGSTQGQCPADQFAATSVVCRQSVGPCDVAENCPGNGPACPADQFAASTVVCRPAVDQCDVAENCPGNGSTLGQCLPNAFQPTGTACNDQNACSADETCNGSGACVNSCGVTVSQANCPGKFTGGGQFNDEEGDLWSFGFNAKGVVNQSASGHDNEVEHSTNQKINGDVIAIMCVNTNQKMTFKVRDKQTGCVLIVYVEDNGESGAGQDRIRKTVAPNQSPGAICPTVDPTEGGTLTAGNIQGHPPN
jgi:hypothetical protein